MNNTAYDAVYETAGEMMKPESLKPFKDVTNDISADTESGIYAEKSAPNQLTAFDSREEATNGSQNPTIKEPLKIRVLPTVPFSVNYRGLQLWEGRVESVDKDFFTAIISDRTHPNLPDESVDISLDDLPYWDRDRVKPGALFVWSIAYADAGSGRTTVSEIRFRRFRKWNGKSIKAVEKSRALLDSIIDGE
jgi:hypothetical protein